MRSFFALLAFSAVMVLAGCRGMESGNPPIHPNLNMDFQEKFDPQEANPFFADGAAMRPLVPGAVARGQLREEPQFYLGRTEGGEYVGEMPLPLTRALLQRGQERYNIYCVVCHGRAGGGEGVIMTGNQGSGYGYTPAPSYHVERLREVSDGYMYDVVANGIRNMPGYAQQIPVADRWAIVAYVRALQRSQNASEDDVPASVRARIAQGSSANMEGQRSGTGAAGSADTSDASTGAPDDASDQSGASGE